MSFRVSLADEPEFRKAVNELIEGQFKSIIREEIDQVCRNYFLERVDKEYINRMIKVYVDRELGYRDAGSIDKFIDEAVKRLITEKIERELHLDFKEYAKEAIDKKISGQSFYATVRID